jgi:hypothetical protein
MENPQNATTGDQLIRSENPLSFDEITQIDLENKEQGVNSSNTLNAINNSHNTRHNHPNKNTNSYYQQLTFSPHR